ncbi:PREDICTED: uncharacterized protein LOC108762430 [Trachymyrmex cornetzi]|uniref:uncharacterized protein LOC108762430 n=1 Tax=Trachymyrmex cornetzi TaxID=471704 RepID=UPI00084F21A7|nr:PREDICTED: uncharacterized protein LOC108762430 [Trachymyrmex cornetzi]
MYEVAIDKHYIKNHPQLHNPNWVRVGNVQYMFIYPIKGGKKMQHNFFRYNHNGMITQYSRSQVFWDGMYLLYNQQTKRILHWSNTSLLGSISVDMTQDGTKIFNSSLLNNLDILCITEQSIKENSRICYYSSWQTGRPLKLIDHGDEAAEWITKGLKFDAPIRLLERSCDPLIEESNIIRENWIDYCGKYSTRSDEKPEKFADLTRCVLMTEVTLHKLLREATNVYNNYVIRPNIVVSTPQSTLPFSEEDWEWISHCGTLFIFELKVPYIFQRG